MKNKYKFIDRINPFYKAITILISTLILSLSYSLILNIVVFLVCIFSLIFFSNVKKTLIIKILVPAFIIAISFFMTGYIFSANSNIKENQINSRITNTNVDKDFNSNKTDLNFAIVSTNTKSMYNGLQLSFRILAFASMGILFALSTNPDLFVSSLIHQAKLPHKYAYAVLAAIHIVPTIKEEYQNVLLAYKVRGIKVNIFSMKPLFTMLVNTIHWSDNIAMAMQSKGFDETQDRSYYNITSVKKTDAIICISFVISVIIGVIFLKF